MASKAKPARNAGTPVGAIVGQLVIPTFPISRQLHVSYADSHCGHRIGPTMNHAVQI